MFVSLNADKCSLAEMRRSAHLRIPDTSNGAVCLCSFRAASFTIKFISYFFGHKLHLNPSATVLDSASWLSPFTCQYTHNAVSSRMNKQQSRSRTQLENSSPLPRQTRGVSTEQVLTMTNKSISPSLFLSFSDAIRRGVDRVTTAP